MNSFLECILNLNLFVFLKKIVLAHLQIRYLNHVSILVMGSNINNCRPITFQIIWIDMHFALINIDKRFRLQFHEKKFMYYNISKKEFIFSKKIYLPGANVPIYHLEYQVCNLQTASKITFHWNYNWMECVHLKLVEHLVA